MARDFFDELSDTITRTTKDLGKKAGQLYETQKIKSKISSEEQMVRKLQADIGNVIFEKYKEGAEVEEGLLGLCEEIQQHMDIIAGYQDMAARLKGQKICPACGKSVDRSVAFCPFCGSVCPTPEPEKAEGDVVEDAPAEEEKADAETVQETEAVEAEENTAESVEEAGDVKETEHLEGTENEETVETPEKSENTAE
ncbi:MAG: zinc ribbon domain-containing protein [Clostridia bacterium]|nr:zinc ribbon domain-containing protein [Clostridia bacterium]